MSIVRRKILLTGKDGQVGWELQRTFATLGDVSAVGRERMDLADPGSIRRIIRDVKPDLIINAAAYTAVDKAESEPDLAMAINGLAPGIMAEEAKRLGAALIHYSTDYVFDGTKAELYAEDDVPNPINVYGKTKLAGERAIQAVGVPHLIFRTSWVYGIRGKNFMLTILRLAKERSELRIVDDQFGTPTWSRMIAEATAQIVAKAKGSAGLDLAWLREKSGVYHATASGRTSWCDFARAILDETRHAPDVMCRKVTAIDTADYPLPACRPMNSCMANHKLLASTGISLGRWEQGLRLCLEETGPPQLAELGSRTVSG